MAKELPFFKFEPSEWDNGNIQMCSRESKGLFIDLCAIYWNRLGVLPYALALQKHCNGDATLMNELQEHQIIGVENDQIIITFLDEQLDEFQKTSEKRRKSAEIRWGKSKRNASALQVESKRNAIREEKRREEEKRKDETWSEEVEQCFENCLKHFPETLHPKENQESNWKQTIDQLNRIEKLPFDFIEKIVNLARSDDFWSKNFLSITKLRKKNKDGVMYVQYFYERFKNEKQGITKTITEQFANHPDFKRL